jgi:protein-L-isoaspartate(D-aspartate) O-methyltransferase
MLVHLRRSDPAVNLTDSLHDDGSSVWRRMVAGEVRGGGIPGTLREGDLVEAARRVGVEDDRVLDAIAAIPRAAFVPPAHAGDAYLDVPIPIPHGQVTTQPSLVAAMVEALALTGSENVLEVGTGYGWQTALLSRLAHRVWSMERLSDFAEAATLALVRRGIENVRVVVGDGSRGLEGRAPYDAILVAAAFPEVPDPLIEQLAAGGRLVQPIGRGGAEEVILFEKSETGRLERKGRVMRAHFVRLYGRHGFPLS